jgi:1-aminocyclopropane-1-carboxylate deaminase/D-cysteine desulfhydrase-like pyridoxal-dependent ACC family enzyme
MAMTSLAVVSRFALATLPTPLVEAPRLGRDVFVKRDDLAGFAAAGHKARQLEFLVGDALALGCDVLVTGGGPRSNWIAAAAVAASVAGLGCELVLFGDRPARPHPNLALALAAGARPRFTGDPDRAAVDDAVLDVAAARGPGAYPIRRGGATPVGAVGMALAAGELPDGPGTIVVATGSGGACAGLAVGAAPRGWTVVGASVSRPLDEATAQVQALADGCAALLGRPPARATLVDARGPCFGVPSAEGEAAARVGLRTDGLLLDPVYTAKAFAVFLRMASERHDGLLVFWHTGGLVSAADHLAGRP